MTLEEAVKKCRELGITKFRGHITKSECAPDCGCVYCAQAVEFELGPAPTPAAQVEEEFKVPVVDNPVESVKSATKRGKDGLTAAEQLEIYGVVIDAEE
jgi:hypothetical protein